MDNKILFIYDEDDVFRHPVEQLTVEGGYNVILQTTAKGR